MSVWEFLTETCPCIISSVDIGPRAVVLHLRAKINFCQTGRISWPLSVKFRMSLSKCKFSDTQCSVNLNFLKGVHGVLHILHFWGGEGGEKSFRRMFTKICWVLVVSWKSAQRKQYVCRSINNFVSVLPIFIAWFVWKSVREIWT